MTRDQQKALVTGLASAVAADICKKIDAGAIPENWDGIELRQILAENTATETYFGKERPYKKTGKRYQAYRETVILNNL